MLACNKFPWDENINLPRPDRPGTDIFPGTQSDRICSGVYFRHIERFAAGKTEALSLPQGIIGNPLVCGNLTNLLFCEFTQRQDKPRKLLQSNAVKEITLVFCFIFCHSKVPSFLPPGDSGIVT